MAEEDIVGRVSATLDASGVVQGANQVEAALNKMEQSVDKKTKGAASKAKKNLGEVAQAATKADQMIEDALVSLTSTTSGRRKPKRTREEISAQAEQRRAKEAQDKEERDKQNHLQKMGRLEEEAYREDAKRTQKILDQQDRERKRFILQSTREENRLKRQARTQARAEMEAEGKRQRAFERQQSKEANDERKRLDAARRKEELESTRDLAAVRRVQDRIVQAPAPLQASILGTIQGPQAQAQRRTLMASGMTRMQAMAFQMQQVQGINQQSALWAVGGGGVRPPTFGGRVPGGGGPGSPGGFMGRLGRFGASLATGLGIMSPSYTIVSH